MRRVIGLVGLMAAVLGIGCGCAERDAGRPHLEEREGMKKLIVDGRPFICVAGELANSSSSDEEAMKAVWPRLAKANLNTVLTVVSWDLIEPEEGKFDFSMVDYQIEAARENKLRLIFLWMGSWKNGLSHYAPAWVKRDVGRFPRVINGEGKPLEILSTLSAANRDADARAFAGVMRNIREVDGQRHTVIAMQVENEVGVQGSTRDFCPVANSAYAAAVPGELMGYLVKNKESLLPELRKVWEVAGGKTSGTWEEVFGKNAGRPDKPVPNNPTRGPRAAGAELFDQTDEIFMAWNYSKYIGHVAAEGKKEYDIPMYVNAWIVQRMDLGPGDYPSGGPQVFVHDVWRAGAPAIDILAPDVYLPQFAEIMRSFARNGNPAFCPETRQDGNNCWLAFTELNALCFSPFGIDNVNPEGDFARAYGLVNGLSGAIAQAQGRKEAIKVVQMKAGENPGKVEMGEYVFDFTPVAARGGGGRGGAAATGPAAAAGPGGLAFMDGPYVVVTQTGEDEFYFATNGSFPFRIYCNEPGMIAGPAVIDRGYFEDGKWVRVRRMNGDDLMGMGYDVSAAAADGRTGTQVPLGRGRGTAAGGMTIMRVSCYRYR